MISMRNKLSRRRRFIGGAVRWRLLRPRPILAIQSGDGAVAKSGGLDA